MESLKNFNDFINEREEKTEPVNEGAGLILGGVILGAIALPGILSWAKHAWTKWMMEQKYKNTGKKEMVPYKEEEVKFEEVVDTASGKKFWGVVVKDSSKADPGHENEQFFLFDEAGFQKVKAEMAKGNFTSAGSVKSWSKTPGNVGSDY